MGSAYGYKSMGIYGVGLGIVWGGGCGRGKVAHFRSGRQGQVEEWLEDFEEAAPNHRHMSHLIALYPENQISPFTTPDLARAAEVTIERRIQSPNWEDTEWSWANLVNFYARLGNGDAAYHHLRGLLSIAP